MPIYSLGKGIWRVRFMIEGHRHDRVVHGSRKDAEAGEAKMRQDLTCTPATEVTTPTAPTFYEFCVNRYKRHAELKLKANTWVRRRYIVATLMQFFGGIELTDFTLDHIENFMRYRQSSNGAVTINDELRVLHRILTYAQELGLPVQIPKWKPLRERTRRAVPYWTEDQVARLLTAVSTKSPNILPLVVCLANTGIRCGEALALTWADVDLENREIRIEAKPEAGWSPKSDKWRNVPLNDDLLPFLAHPGKATDPVFPSPSTNRRYAHWPNCQFDRARKAAGLQGGPHTLRHTYASHFLRNNPDLYLLSRVLGHSHTRVTELYSHLLPDALAAARRAVSFASPVGAAELVASRRWGTKKAARNNGK